MIFGFRLPRPRHPVSGKYFLGGILLAWGLYVMAFPSSNLTAITNWRWLSETGETVEVAMVASLIGAFQIFGAYKLWRVRGQFFAAFAMSLWFTFAFRTFIASHIIHAPASAVYFALAIANTIVIFAEEID